MKRNTSFIKKIRQLNEDNVQSLVVEMKQLNLSRYVSEIPTALQEAKFRISDMGVFIAFSSAVHQRYADFSDLLAASFKAEMVSISTSLDSPNEQELLSNYKVFSSFSVSLSVFLFNSYFNALFFSPFSEKTNHSEVVGRDVCMWADSKPRSDILLRPTPL